MRGKHAAIFLALSMALLWAHDGAGAEREQVRVHSPSFDISVIPLYIAKDKGYLQWIASSFGTPQPLPINETAESSRSPWNTPHFYRAAWNYYSTRLPE